MKGTTFGVEVTDQSSQVSVTEGVVQVVDYLSGDSADLRPKQSASSEAGSKSGISLGGEGPLPMIRRGPPRQPVYATSAALPTAAQVPGGSVPRGTIVTATAPSFEASTPARSHFLTVSYYLNDAGSAEVILSLVILGSIGSGIIVWVALSFFGAMRRGSEGTGRDRKKRP